MLFKPGDKVIFDISTYSDFSIDSDLVKRIFTIDEYDHEAAMISLVERPGSWFITEYFARPTPIDYIRHRVCTISK